jgi:hypothetical protein
MARLLVLIPIVLLVSLAVPGASQAQWIYFGTPGDCSTSFDASLFRGTWHMVIHAPELSDATGATFRLESDTYGPEDAVTIVPAEGVTMTGDLFQGMTAAWTPRALEHESLMTLIFTDNPPFRWPAGYYLAVTRDVVVSRSGGGAMELEDVGTELVHCHGGGACLFQRPDTALVTCGEVTVVTFRGIGINDQWGPVATDITATDEEDWTTGLTPTYLWGHCDTCPWSWSTFQLTVAVPAGVTDGSLSKVTLWDHGIAKLTEFILKADDSVPVEEHTWGAIKAIYKD